jgi:catechol 2,3-dioxygenase-like lactoylglutathione lyase family enzyme
MDKRFVVVSLWAEDVPKLVHFYRDVLGLGLKTHHGHQPHFDVSGVNLVILQGVPTPAQEALPPRFPLFALQVEDLDTEMSKLNKHGIELPWGVEGGPGSRYVMFHDPGGNLIELVEYVGK